MRNERKLTTFADEFARNALCAVVVLTTVAGLALAMHFCGLVQ
jgi:hypothetical protein